MFPRPRFLYALAAALFAAMFSSMAAHATEKKPVPHEHHNTSTSAQAQASAKADAASDASIGDSSYVSLSLALSGCQQGAGASGAGFGATLGAESRVCQLLRLAAAHQALGQPYEAMRLVRQATEEVNGGGYTPDEAPVTQKISRGFRRYIVAPLFGWLPFVGHAV